MGIRLEGSVLIVDEAHNLVDAVNSAHGASITWAHVTAAQIQLNGYYECFRTRLSPGKYLHALQSGLINIHQGELGILNDVSVARRICCVMIDRSTKLKATLNSHTFTMTYYFTST